MMRILASDLLKMYSDVDGVIDDWAVQCIITTPLDEAQQTNYNAIMREFTGTPGTTHQHVGIEIRSNDGTNQLRKDVGGNKFVDDIDVNIPLKCLDDNGDTVDTLVTADSIFSDIIGYPGKWRVISLRLSVGEISANIQKMVGDE